MLIEILALVATLVLLLWLFFEAPIRSLKEKLKPIPGPEPLPIVGNLISLKTGNKGTLHYLIECNEKYGPVFKVQFGGRLTVSICNPEDVELLLKSNDLLEKSRATVEFFREWLGKGLVVSEGALWKEHRKLITPTFHFNILEKFFEVFREQSNIQIEILSKKTNQNLDIFPFMQLFAMDVICETAMGTKIQAQTKLEGNDYVMAVKQITECISKRFTSLLLSIGWLYSFTRTGRREKEALKIIRSYTNKIIEKRREQLMKEANNEIPNGNVSETGEKRRVVFLDLLLQARHSDGTPLTNKEIFDEVQTFMFAGHDTTSTQMSYLLYLLSKEPEIQEKLYKEQMEIMEGEKRDPTFKDIQNMHYLERTIKESQRLYGSVIMFGRQLSHELILKTNGYILPKGTHVNVFAYQLHRNPNVYPNPEKFDPDRFLPENVRTRNAFAFVPFSAGPRNCIGLKFAMLEMKTCVSNIIRHFKILPAVDSQGKLFEPDMRSIILLTSLNGICIRLCARE